MSVTAALLLAAAAPAQFTGPADSPRRVSVNVAEVRAVILRAARAAPEAGPGELQRRIHEKRDGTLSLDFD